MIRSEFVFALCQPGAESALKREVQAKHEGLRPGYERKGLLTFRSRVELSEEHRVDAVLARASGLSLGLYADVAAARARIEALPQPLRLHVIEREPAPQTDDQSETLAQATESALRSMLPETFLAGDRAQPGELVLDVIAAPGEPLLLGVHRVAEGEPCLPGGRYAYELPPEAPSRAFAKIEEAILAFGLPVRAGDVALELGAAPGGAAYALLRRGVSVVAVDPAEMDPSVLGLLGPAGARLSHVRKPMGAVTRSDLPAQVQWLLLDVHLAPQVALRSAGRFASMFRRSLLGAVLTLKLNDWAFLDQLDRFEAAARSMGLIHPRARQLPAHRQELALAGLTELGQRR
jgi:23S rRNA (cytidine2498-2'-O)-methyltransferase